MKKFLIYGSFFLLLISVGVKGESGNEINQSMEDVVKKVDNIAAILAIKFFAAEDKNDKQLLKEINRAIKEYEKILKKNQDSVRVYEVLGTAQMYKQRHIPAIKTFEKCIRLDPKNYSAYYALGLCHQKLAELSVLNGKKNLKKAQKEYKIALIMYNKALEINQDIELAKTALKSIHKDLEFINDKEKFIKRQAEWDMEQQQTSQIDKYWDLAQEAGDKEDHARAISYLKKISKVKSNYLNCIINYNIGLEYKYWEKYKKAIEFYNKQILLSPGKAPELLYSHLGLMECYYELGEFSNAKQECNMALKLDPGNKKAKRYIKKFKKQKNKSKK